MVSLSAEASLVPLAVGPVAESGASLSEALLAGSLAEFLLSVSVGAMFAVIALAIFPVYAEFSFDQVWYTSQFGFGVGVGAVCSLQAVVVSEIRAELCFVVPGIFLSILRAFSLLGIGGRRVCLSAWSAGKFAVRMGRLLVGLIFPSLFEELLEFGVLVKTFDGEVGVFETFSEAFSIFVLLLIFLETFLDCLVI